MLPGSAIASYSPLTLSFLTSDIRLNHNMVQSSTISSFHWASVFQVTIARSVLRHSQVDSALMGETRREQLS